MVRKVPLLTATDLSIYLSCSGEDSADAESALEFLAKHCRWAVVTLGAKGCIAKHGKEVCDHSSANNFYPLETTHETEK